MSSGCRLCGSRCADTACCACERVPSDSGQVGLFPGGRGPRRLSHGGDVSGFQFQALWAQGPLCSAVDSFGGPSRWGSGVFKMLPSLSDGGLPGVAQCPDWKVSWSQGYVQSAWDLPSALPLPGQLVPGLLGHSLPLRWSWRVCARLGTCLLGQKALLAAPRPPSDAVCGESGARRSVWGADYGSCMGPVFSRTP